MISLIADICNMPVQLPYSHSASVVLGSAMLGCAAAEEASRLQTSRLDNQEAAEKSSFGMKDRLWDVMVPAFRYVAREGHGIGSSPLPLRRSACPDRELPSSRLLPNRSSSSCRSNTISSANASTSSVGGAQRSAMRSASEAAGIDSKNCFIEKGPAPGNGIAIRSLRDGTDFVQRRRAAITRKEGAAGRLSGYIVRYSRNVCSE